MSQEQEDVFHPDALTSQRSAGYRNTTRALAELVDNSFDANAKHIKIIFIEKQSDKNKTHIDQILVCDDGEGMNEEVLSKSLVLGQGLSATLKQDDAINQRRKGKFGFGLPSASISQCERVEVYSWQKDLNQARFTYLDLPELIEKCSLKLPKPVNVGIQAKFKDLPVVTNTKHGTIISWSKCDRLSNVKAMTHIEKLKWKLGRLFRHQLRDNEVTISFHSFMWEEGVLRISHVDEGMTEEGMATIPIDPLFLMPNSGMAPQLYEIAQGNGPIAEHYRKFASSEDSTKHSPTSILHSELTADFLFRGKSHKFTFTASIANIDIQKPGVREGGAHGVGKRFYGKLCDEDGNISFVRADREIESGTFGIYNRFNSPEHRWWAIEVKFDQDSDELMGVSNNKQSTQFRSTSKTDAEDLGLGLSQEDDPNESFTLGGERLRAWLTERLVRLQRELFREVKKQGKDWDNLNIPKPPPLPIPIEVSDTSEIVKRMDRLREERFKPEILSALKESLRKRYPGISETDIEVTAESFDASESSAIIIYAGTNSPILWTTASFQGLLLIAVNTEHPFYEIFIDPLRQSPKDREKLVAFELLVHVMANQASIMESSEEVQTSKVILDDFREETGIKLKKYLRHLVKIIQTESDEDKDLEDA